MKGREMPIWKQRAAGVLKEEFPQWHQLLQRLGGQGGATPLDPAAMAVGTSSPLVTKLWSKGSVVKNINVQDVSAKKLPPKDIRSGLRKSPPQ